MPAMRFPNGLIAVSVAVLCNATAAFGDIMHNLSDKFRLLALHAVNSDDANAHL